MRWNWPLLQHYTLSTRYNIIYWVVKVDSQDQFSRETSSRRCVYSLPRRQEGSIFYFITTASGWEQNEEKWDRSYYIESGGNWIIRRKSWKFYLGNGTASVGFFPSIFPSGDDYITTEIFFISSKQFIEDFNNNNNK